MTEKLEQTIKEELGKMPKELQITVDSFGWTKIVEEIGKKYFLDESETNNLQLETLLVLIGLTDPSLYPKNIEHEVGMSENEARKISDEIDDYVFTPIASEIERKIKAKVSEKNPTMKENLYFILSGGDYSAFIGNPKERETSEEVKKQDNITKPPGNIEDIRKKFVI